MCLAVFAWKSVPGLDLVLAANRDEFHARPSAPAAFWEEAPHVLAGRDLQGSGTWLGVTDDGRFAFLTNVRNPFEKKPGAPSRGLLVSAFLTGEDGPADYAALVASEAARYAGFNLVVGDEDEAFFVASHTPALSLAPGFYGLSNAALDTPWPKVVRTKKRLESALSDEVPELDALVALLDDRTTAPDGELPETGVGLEWERILSAPFIVTPTYGTRTTTALVFGDEEIEILERTFDAAGRPLGDVRVAV